MATVRLTSLIQIIWKALCGYWVELYRKVGVYLSLRSVNWSVRKKKMDRRPGQTMLGALFLAALIITIDGKFLYDYSFVGRM